MGNLLLRLAATVALLGWLVGPVCAADSTSVTFRYVSGKAHTVTVAGNFNGWNPAADSLVRTDKTWTLAKSLPAGYYYYKFVVDGKWIADPKNPQKINDGGNGFNSILKVGDPPRPKRLTRKEPPPEGQLPLPIVDGNPEYLELWRAAWRMAWNKLAHGTPQNWAAIRIISRAMSMSPL